MAKQQTRPIAPPVQADVESLQDFSSVIQDNLFDLFNAAHDHNTRTTAPASTEGVVGDIVLVFLSPDWYIYAKVDTTTWKRTAALI